LRLCGKSVLYSSEIRSNFKRNSDAEKQINYEINARFDYQI